MWKHVQTQESDTLINLGVAVIGPDSGIQACGDIGSGRMTEPIEIVNTLESQLARGPLAHRKVLITAGPLMSRLILFAISQTVPREDGIYSGAAASRLGGSVTLISGPAHLETPAGVARIDVETAQEMLTAVENSRRYRYFYRCCGSL